MLPESDEPIRRLLARYPRPRLSEGFSGELTRRVRQQEVARGRQRGVGTRLVLGAYWLAALLASAWILKQGPVPEWATSVLWLVAIVLVPAGYALVLWSGIGGFASRERG